jgi:hypothetical protein
MGAKDMSSVETKKPHQESFQDYATNPVKAVQEHPIPASLVLFGLGVGVGLLLTTKACESMMHQETTSERLSRQFTDAMGEIRGMLQRGLSRMS